ncbi:MAG: alpha amylase C-terminal domain-containing protein [Muribaculaceae bacterium]|nr:alpha amylase C-terminal domain-containing protein [Muribaculaceae bacterium]
MKKPIIYQLFPRWFTYVNDHCVPNGTLRQNGAGKFNEIDKHILTAIKQIGVTHVWYTGIIEHATKTRFPGIKPCNPHVVKGEAGSPYAIRDYYDVSPELAEDVKHRMEEFESLVQRTHDAGMKVIIDFVPNHVAREYASDAKPKGVKDLGEDDNKGMFFEPNNNFYYITGQAFAPSVDMGQGKDAYQEMPARATGNDCWHASPSINDWYETVKLNYGIDPWNGSRHFSPIPDTWHKMLDILMFWCGKGIDGLRCDMAHMVPVEFWHWAIAQVKHEFPHVIFIAEIYDTALYHSYINDGGFDYLYDKVTLYDTLFNIVRNGASTQTLSACWQTVDDIRGHMLNFLENHDELRLASPQFAGDAVKGRPALVVSATISTCPMMIYAGQELGEQASDAEGFSGLDGRTTIFDYWSVPTIRQWLSKTALNRRHPLRDYYKRVLRMCNSEKCIALGGMFDLMYVNPHLTRQYAFLRHHDKDVLLIVANFHNELVTIPVHIPDHAMQRLNLREGSVSAQELLHHDNQTFELSSSKPLTLTIPANDAVIWKFISK